MKTKWLEIVEATKPFNHSLSVILKTAHPISFEKDILSVGVEYSFHVEQLSKAAVKSHFLETVEKLVNKKMNVEFVVDNNHKSNHQNFKGKKEKEVDDVLSTFGGEVV